MGIEQQSSPPPPPPQWVVDLNSTPPARTKNLNVPDPPGYVSTRSGQGKQKSQPTQRKAPTQEETDTLKLKKAWEIAIAPAKQIPMNAVMMYMSGNSLQIFSIMMVYMLFKNPIQGLLNTNLAFTKFETEGTKGKLIGVKIIYILVQGLLLALGVWKVNGMGLLPTTRSDWLAWEKERVPLERAHFAFR